MASRNDENRRFSWKRTWALAVAVGLHAFAFLLMVAPVAPDQPAKVKKEQIVQVNFIEPPPQPPPTPTPPPVAEVSQNQVQAVPPAPPKPPPPPVADTQASQDLSYNSQIQPKYPPQAVRARHEGTVILLILVGTDGSPKDIKVEKSSGYRELDRSAMDAAKQWRFNPTVRNGQKVEGYARVPVTFNLNQM